MNLGSQKKLASIVCSKKPYRTLEDYALTLAGIPPLTATAFKIRSENDELNRLYHSYLKMLEYAAALGDLRAAKAGLNWVCRYEDFQEWAQKTGYMEAPAVESSNDKFEHAETTKWKNQAWEIGETWMKQQREIGENPGIEAIAKYVENKFKTLDIRGRRDDYLDWQTIKREALTGITGRPPNGKGKRSKKA